jgi:tripartite-type tricarboxylate transporter receptor subunit TctC
MVTAALVVTPAAAQSDVSFEDETINIIVGFSPGGGYDFYGRLVARHLPKYLEGNPDVIVQNMPGAGSTIAANHIYKQADADGTAIGFIDGGNAILQLTEGAGARFDLRDFNYMGGFSENEVVVVAADKMADTPLGVFNADEPVKFGHFGGGSFHTTYIGVMVDAMDSNAQLIGGYGGASEVMPAIERDEVDGTALTYGTIRPHIERGAVAPVVMSGPKTEGLEDVAVAMDVAPTETGKSMLSVMNGVLEARRIFVLPPDTPEDVVKALQAAYVDALQDEALLEEARKAGRPTNYITGERAKEIMDEALEQPAAVVEAFQEIVGG